MNEPGHLPLRLSPDERQERPQRVPSLVSLLYRMCLGRADLGSGVEVALLERPARMKVEEDPSMVSVAVHNHPGIDSSSMKRGSQVCWRCKKWHSLYCRWYSYPNHNLALEEPYNILLDLESASLDTGTVQEHCPS